MGNKRIYLSPPHIGQLEQSYIADAFEKNWITTAGDNIENFEKGLCTLSNCGHCVALNSGTSALHLALILLGVKKDDEVICSSFTFVASANPILYLGATPVFVDSESDTWNMSPILLEEAITDRIKKGKKPKAIILVHLYGQPAKLKEILAISEKYDITLIEDAAESLGSTYDGKMTGTFGEMGLYSFNGNKIITTSGGGALISNKPEHIEKAKFLSQQSREKEVHYQHEELGYNYRMSNILAGIGIGQLAVLEERIKRKHFLYEFYKTKLEPTGEFSFLNELPNTKSNRWLTTVILKNGSPESLRIKLESENIESRPLWKPLHLQPLFKNAPAYIDSTSDKLFNSGLCLPSGTAMIEEDLEKIINCILKQ